MWGGRGGHPPTAKMTLLDQSSFVVLKLTTKSKRPIRSMRSYSTASTMRISRTAASPNTFRAA